MKYPPIQKIESLTLTQRKIVVLIPYPAQGHVTPMLNLAAALLGQGLRPLVLTPDHIHRRIAPAATAVSGVTFAGIPCGSAAAGDFFAVEAAMENDMPAHLESLLVGGHVACVVVDLVASWAIDVARRCCVPVVGFWPAMLATYHLIAAVPDMIRSGLISDEGTPKHQGTIRLIPNQSAVSTEELPWLIGPPTARRARFKFWTKALSRSKTLPLILINSFEQPDNDDTTCPTLVPLGILTAASRPGRALWDEDATCLSWLDCQKPGSVVYVSFGSWVSPIGESKVCSLAQALEGLGRAFLWVLGESWRHGLPEGCGAKGGRGKVVSWAPQMTVLAHAAVGCYVTHCGWNSTVEAVRCQKRMVCYPIAGDQFVNCGYIVDVWRVGVRIAGLGRAEVEEGLRKVGEDEGIAERLRLACEMVDGDEARFKARSSLAKFGQFTDREINGCNEPHHHRTL